MKRWFMGAALLSSIGALAGCAPEVCGDADCVGRRGRGTNADGDGGSENTSSVQEGMTCANTAKPHEGFGSEDLARARSEGKGGADRGRTKPYEVLVGDYARVLGSTPAPMAKLGPTFGQAQARRHVEPRPTAVTVSSALVVAFEGCLDYTKTAPEYENAPEPSTALAACSAMARRFWSRVVTPEDVQGCVDVALTDSVKETYASGADGAPMTTDTTPRRRWAYACASLLTATQFLSY